MAYLQEFERTYTEQTTWYFTCQVVETQIPEKVSDKLREINRTERSLRNQSEFKV